MGSECEAAKDEIKTRLAYRNGFLCVVAERWCADGPQPKTVKLWYPVREAEEAETRTLLGRPVAEIDPKEGIYVDEEGTVFQLAEKGETKPMAVVETPSESGELEQLLAASLKNGNSSEKARTHALQRPTGRPKKRASKVNGSAKPDHGLLSAAESSTRQPSDTPDWDRAGIPETTHLNLRQKLAEVRRRIGYIQKRGFNERNNYSYVTAADLAGAVGDILAELGVVIVPRLESISYEPNQPGRPEVARAAQVVMAYTFTDIDSGDEITTKVAGQGLDAGDKAPYKAMTGALKYALLQSFLLATGDDPEDERIGHSPSGNGTERLINPEEILKLRALVNETETELDRVLSYYKITSLEEMRESSYRRAVELLNRKRAKQTEESNHYAQN
jgi:hypothetical protein